MSSTSFLNTVRPFTLPCLPSSGRRVFTQRTSALHFKSITSRTRTLPVLASSSSSWTGTYEDIPGTTWEDIRQRPESFPSVTTANNVDVGENAADLLAIGVFEDDIPGWTLTTSNAALQAAVQEIIDKGDFKGKSGQKEVVRVGDGVVKNVGLFGLGQKSDATIPSSWGRSAYYKFAGAAGKSGKEMKTQVTSYAFSSEPSSSAPYSDIATHVIMGSWLETYESTRFKSDPQNDDNVNLNTLVEITLLNFGITANDTGIAKGNAYIGGSSVTMYAGEAPPNCAFPEHLSDIATHILNSYDNFTLQVLNETQCEQMGMGCFLGVTNGSVKPAQFIHLTYKNGTSAEPIAFVGKGITFDTGGYNLKVAGGIEEMKFDMCGGAAVLGAADIIGSLQPTDVEIHFIIAACHNMIDGKAYRPSDILKSYKGITVEIVNTDAEGRLVLCDALHYAQVNCNAKVVVDMATLTGDMMKSLGYNIAGLFTNSDSLWSEWDAASRSTGDRVWRMPLETDYVEDMKKGIADLKHLGSSPCGAIVGAMFLREFIDLDQVQWAHLDIAGVSWTHGSPMLGTGYGAALFAEWILSRGSS